ncbi:FitA-like ribbon-helix-helix domain-containing protein [Nocardiopsis sp. LOL_012]|uniref:FitA-like ribbon-helix-helix domain-containing protein n=1 Tax=Nocardiopsis sp. LOL_012 TaxID=3345409 RepID=UPI003A847143
MADLTITGIPEGVVREMRVRAARAGESLQDYARTVLTRDVAEPTLADAVAGARRTALADIPVSDVLATVDEGRTEAEQRSARRCGP